MGKSTEQVVREYKQQLGREENARLLFRRYYGQVYRFFRRKGFSVEDGEELTEEVFLSVYKELQGLREEAKFESWMFSIARNVYRNELERRGAKKRAAKVVSLSAGEDEREEIQLSASPVSNPDLQVLEKEKMEKMREALLQLPKQMRRCLYLRVDDGLSYKEIATVMGISINTVSVHLHQARKILKEKLSSYFGEPAL